MRFLGHLLRLDIETPVRKVLEEYFRPTLRDPGRPITTWWTFIKKDLEKTDVITELVELLRLATNRKEWNDLMARCVRKGRLYSVDDDDDDDDDNVSAALRSQVLDNQRLRLGPNRNLFANPQIQRGKPLHDRKHI